MASQRMGIVGLVLGLGIVVAGGLFMVLSDPNEPAEGPAPEVAPEVADGAPGVTDTKETGGRKARDRKPGGKYAATILGEVRLRKGDAPAVGQEVVVKGADAGDVWTAECDESGAFRIESLPPGGPYELSVTADSFATVLLPGIALDRKEERDVGTLTLDGAVRLSVEVRNYANQPIEGASVSAYANASAQSYGMDWMKRLAQIGVTPIAVTSTTSDAQGVAVFPKLATGRWTVVATKKGYSRAGRTTPKLTSEREPAPVKLHMGTGNSLTGKVLDQADEPIADALVMAGSGQVWDMSRSPVRARSQTDAEGHYAFEDLPSGDTTIWAARPGGVPVQVAKVRIPDVDAFVVHIRSGGVLTGIVTDTDTGKPVADAEVRAQSWSNGWRIALATTDAEGRYTMDTLIEGAVNQLTVEKEGYAQVVDPSQQAWSQIALNAGDVVERNLELREAASLTGRVLGPNDEGLSGANVTAMGRSGNGNIDQKQATTDSEGRYRFTALNKGDWVLQVTKSGYYQRGFPQNSWMLVQQGNAPEEFSVEVPEKGEVEKDVHLVAGNVVEGLVEDMDGQPVAGATITGYGSGQLSGETDENGKFSLKGFKPGVNNNVSASKEGYVAASEAITVLDGEPTTDIVLTLHPTPTVRGVITSSSGNALTDAYVQVRVTADASGNVQPWQIAQMNQVDWSGMTRSPVFPDGSYEIDVPGKAGKFIVRAVARGHEALESDATALAEGTLEYEVNLELTQGYEVTGRVVAKGSTVAVPGATVSITAAKPSTGMLRMGGMITSFTGNENLETVLAVTDSQGNFKVRHMSEGAYEAKAEAVGYVKSSQKFKLPGAGTVTIEIDPALEIVGKVRFADGTPVVGAMVAAQRGSGGQMNSFPGQGGNNTATTGSDGSFVIRRLTDGQYTLNVTPPWGGDVNVRPTKVESVAAGRSDVDVVAEPGLGIGGKILGPGNKPLAGIQVYAQSSKPTPGNFVYRWARSAEDGTFEINGLVEGQYTVNIQTQWSGAADLQAEKKENVPAGTSDLVIALAAGLEISGRVVDAENKPMAGQMMMLQKLLESGGMEYINNQVTTDSDGKFTARGLAPGTYRFNLQNNMGMQGGGGVLRGAEKVAAGSTGVTFTLSDGVTIEGRVVDSAGKPVQGANIMAHNAKGGMWKRAQSDANGDFAVKGLDAEAEYTVTAQKQGLVQDMKSPVMSGSTGVTFTLTAGFTISGTFLEGAGLMDMSAYIWFRHKESNASGAARADGDGNFVVEGLAEGEYAISVWVKKEDDDNPNAGEQVEVATARTGDENVVVKRP